MTGRRRYNENSNNGADKGIEVAERIEEADDLLDRFNEETSKGMYGLPLQGDDQLDRLFSLFRVTL
jgi:hypothetical protein